MKATREAKRVPVIIEYTEGYQQRFTKEILKIYQRRELATLTAKENENKEGIA